MTALVSCLRQLALRSDRQRALKACTVPRWPALQTCRWLHDKGLKRGLRGSHTQPHGYSPTSITTYDKDTFADRLLQLHREPKTSDQPVLTGRRHHRASLRAAIKQYSEQHPPLAVLVKPAENTPSQVETRRSHRKHVNSVRTQSLHDIKRVVGGKPDFQWHETLALLAKHTADSREVLRFRVTIGRGAAAQVRNRLLTGLDSNVWQISRRYQSIIHVEETADDGVLALGLSGSKIAVRQSLLELLRVAGQVTALRVHNSELRAALAKDWEEKNATTARVKLLGIGDIAAEDATLTLADQASAALLALRDVEAEEDTTTVLDEAPAMSTKKHKFYKLDRPANAIEMPALWTKHSFEEYVVALTYGQVPPEKHHDFYGNGPDHQEVVAALLVRAFTLAETRPAISLSAVKLALTYLQKRGPGFRRAHEQVFAQIDLQDLPADTETYDILLVGAARWGDSRSYISVLKTMVRKGFRPQATAWLAFFEMTHDRNRKHKILAGMRKKGLDRIRPIYDQMTRRQALLALESQLAKQAKSSHEGEAKSYHIGALVQERDRQHGQTWLDTMTLNKMLEVLGRSLEFDACKHLLAIAQKERRVKPDVVTLNTMITHIRDVSEWIGVMETLQSRHPRLTPDEITYHKLFSIAWTLNKPNMMAVVWRYATIAKLAPSKMVSRLNSLFVREAADLDSASLRQRRFWLPIIFGHDESGGPAAPTDWAAKPHSFYEVMARFREANKNKTPTAGLAQKLREAYDNDTALNKLKKEKSEVTAENMGRLSVAIPMQPVSTSGKA